MNQGLRDASRRLVAVGLVIVMVILGIPWAMTGCQPEVSYGAGLTTAEILAVTETIEDEAAKNEIITAVNEGAEVTFSYTADGRVASYRIVREGVSKKHEDMTEEEKRQALDLLIEQGVVENRILVDGTYYSLNITLWMEQGIIVYGETAEVNNAVSVTSGSNYKDGQYRFWGYDINGGLYGNDDFPRDSDSGTPAYEKDWLTTEEIRESAVARGYIGEHGMNANGKYGDGDKKRTADAWLSEHPEWIEAGLDTDYILEHFYFNSVLSDNGLTTGQFTGVHLSRYNGTLYYQSFSVQGEIPTFVVTEGTVEERVLIEDGTSGGDAGDSGEDEDDSPSEVDMEVELALPKVSYVGHPVTATDRTAFTVNGESRSATRVYAEGLAKNTFRLPDGGGTIRKNNSVPTKAQTTFDKAGTHRVMLTVTAGGSSSSDTKTIEVVKTPAIIHSLTGTQKQNRAQTLNVWVATDPKRTLEEAWIEVKDTVTGELVHLDHHVGSSAGTANGLDNTEMIKTRPVERLDSDELFTNFRLEFLTKNEEEREFEYTIYVKDVEGNTDRIVQNFKVVPDLAPEAAVVMEPSFIRERGENYAVVTAEDGSKTDGDQLKRQWSFVTLDPEGDYVDLKTQVGYEDLSFGTAQKIGFHKDGVGTFRVKLQVTDVWAEPTLEEYVTDADRKSAVTTKDSEVENIAPQVSLEAKEMKTAEILFLTEDGAVYEDVCKQLSQVNTKLLESGYDGTVMAQQMYPAKTSESRPWEKTIEVDTPFGYQGSWIKLFEEDNFITDDRRLYKIDATWLGSDKEFYPEDPYTITAWDGETGDVDWTYTFDESILTVADSGPYFAQDDSGTYLYFVSGKKTLILDKDTGAKLTVLPFAVGESCFTARNRIFTVKSDGIYAIHTGTGNVTRIYEGLLGNGSARFAGRLQFVSRVGETLYRGFMNLETQEIKLQKLTGVTLAVGTYDAAAFCTDGTLVVKETTEESIRFLKFGKDGALSGAVSHSAEEMDAAIVRDGSGNVEYVSYIHSDKSGDYYYIYVTCYHLSSGKKAQTYLRNKNGDPAKTKIIAAEQEGDRVYVVAGGYTTWIVNYGWATGAAHGYPERTRTIRFDMTELSGEEVSNETYGLDEWKEYGRSSDVYVAVQAAKNGQYQDPPSGNITTLYRRYQTPEQVEQRYRSKLLSDDGSVDRQEVFVLTAEDLASESLSQMVVQNLEDTSGEATSYVNLTATASGGNLQRTVMLLPNKTYYYEYDLYGPGLSEASVRDIFSVRADLTQRSSELTGKQYRVTKAIMEQFNNNTVENEYYSGILSENLINDRWHVAPTPERLKVRKASATLNFTVETGETAVLSFDYDIKRFTDNGYFGNYILIDGSNWKLPMEEGKTLTGHYTHPFLLSAGNHTIELFCGTYTTYEAHTAIDNLTVEYVTLENEAMLATDNELVDTADSYQEKVGDGWTRVSGSFRTPMENIAYQGISGTVGTENAGKGAVTKLTSSTQKLKEMNYLIPEGETVIYASAATTSTPSKSSSKHYGVFWYLNGTSFTCYLDSYFGTNDQKRLKGTGVPESYDFVMPLDGVSDPGWESPHFKMSFSGTATGTGGTIGKTVLASVKKTDESTENREYFLRPSGTTKGIYTANLKFNTKAQLRFVPGNDGAQGIANLKIYTIENGVKIYVSEEDITQASELNRWSAKKVTAEVKTDGAPVEEETSMVYAKGEAVHTSVFYYDYEGDPSKASYWKYTHLPYNDGPHPQASVVIDENDNAVGGTGDILSEPIQKFYVDGKYIIEHWQTDSTGDPAYDKDSNVAKMIIYIGGGGSAPWIESITIKPSGPEEGDDVTANITVDDQEKDPLQLDIEIYRDGTRISKKTVKNLAADNRGVYPVTISDPITDAEAGKYEIVCTVRDEGGVGIGNRQFTIQPAGSICGAVSHTEAWDSNRRSYNLNLFGEEASVYNTAITLSQYLLYDEPRPRGTNVFWAGEELVLTANVGGSPTSVTAEAGGYTVRMNSTGEKTAKGETIYKGSLWDKTMRSRWGKTPEEITVTFTSYYNSGEQKVDEVRIIVDSNTEYWLLHRYS
ncbi:MAG: hypothetical protein IJ486_03530 [Firmicutes bacterium]|nr:hypothetical protein [Bacillota bacterium]